MFINVQQSLSNDLCDCVGFSIEIKPFQIQQSEKEEEFSSLEYTQRILIIIKVEEQPKSDLKKAYTNVLMELKWRDFGCINKDSKWGVICSMPDNINNVLHNYSNCK